VKIKKKKMRSEREKVQKGAKEESLELKALIKQHHYIVNDIFATVKVCMCVCEWERELSDINAIITINLDSEGMQNILLTVNVREREREREKVIPDKQTPSLSLTHKIISPFLSVKLYQVGKGCAGRASLSLISFRVFQKCNKFVL
jgi:hypothetical protein